LAAHVRVGAAGEHERRRSEQRGPGQALDHGLQYCPTAVWYTVGARGSNFVICSALHTCPPSGDAHMPSSTFLSASRSAGFAVNGKATTGKGGSGGDEYTTLSDCANGSVFMLASCASSMSAASASPRSTALNGLSGDGVGCKTKKVAAS